MQTSLRYRSAILLILLSSGIVVAQVKSRSLVLEVNGRSGEAAVVEIGGREFVDLQAPVRIANGSLGFYANRLVVTFPSSARSPGATVFAKHSDSGFSRDFIKAAIEEIALMREWASPL